MKRRVIKLTLTESLRLVEEGRGGFMKQDLELYTDGRG